MQDNLTEVTDAAHPYRLVQAEALIRAHFPKREDEARRLDGRARRAAKSAGLVARKSRWRAGSIDNFGGFMLIEPNGNRVVRGERYDMTAEDVIAYCSK